MAEIAESLGTAHYDPPHGCINPDDDMRPVVFDQETGIPLPPPAGEETGMPLPPPAGVAPGAVLSEKNSDLNTPAQITNPDTARRGGQKRPS